MPSCTSSLALKYLDDGHLVALQAAMEAKDYSEGYSQAHALKGVAGNLSFKDLYECAALVSDALYAGEYEAAAKHLPEVEAPTSWLSRVWKTGATARCRRGAIPTIRRARHNRRALSNCP